MAIEVPKNEEISKGRNKGERKGVGSAIRRRRANERSVKVKKRERERSCLVRC